MAASGRQVPDTIMRIPAFNIFGAATCCATLAVCPPAAAQERLMKVVAADGSADYTTIQAAVDACPADGTRSLIFIKNGTYKEQLTVPRNVTLSLLGESRDGVIITHDVSHASGLDKDKTSTLYVEGLDFYGENFTTQNTAGRNGGQAECMTNSGDRMVLRNVAMKGNQDAVRFDNASRTYINSCYIEGTVDYIYDSGVAYLDNCEIKQLYPGYIVAPGNSYVHIGRSQSKQLCGQSRLWDIGIVIRDSRLVCDAANVPEGQSYLGRPWGKTSSAAMFIRCKMDRHISPAGFTNMSEGTKTYIGEYRSTDLDGNPIDLSSRISWEFTEDPGHNPQYIDEAVVNNIYDMDFAFTAAGKAGARAGGGFSPLPMIEPAALPETFSAAGGRLSWSKSAEAAGYIVYKNGAYLANLTGTTMTDETMTASDSYTLRTVSKTGCLSNEMGQHASSLNKVTEESLRLIVTAAGASWNGDAAAALYSLGGTAVARHRGMSLSFSGIPPGCYMLRITAAGGVLTKKITVRN